MSTTVEILENVFKTYDLNELIETNLPQKDNIIVDKFITALLDFPKEYYKIMTECPSFFHRDKSKCIEYYQVCKYIYMLVNGFESNDTELVESSRNSLKELGYDLDSQINKWYEDKESYLTVFKYKIKNRVKFYYIFHSNDEVNYESTIKIIEAIDDILIETRVYTSETYDTLNKLLTDLRDNENYYPEVVDYYYNRISSLVDKRPSDIQEQLLCFYSIYT